MKVSTLMTLLACWAGDILTTLPDHAAWAAPDPRQGFLQLQTDLQLVEVPGQPDESTATVEADWTAAGTLSSLSIWRPIRAEESDLALQIPVEDRAQNFLRAYPSLFGFDGERSVDSAFDAGGLRVRRTREQVGPSGRLHESITLAQFVGDIEVDAGDLVFSFVDGALVGFGGSMLPSAKLAAGDSIAFAVTEGEARAAAWRARSADAEVIEYAPRRAELRFSPAADRVVWLIAGNIASRSGDVSGVRDVVDAATGSVLFGYVTDQHAYGTGDFRHYQPTTTGSRSRATGTSDTGAEVYLPNASTVYSWSNDSPDRAPMYNYGSPDISVGHRWLRA